MAVRGRRSPLPTGPEQGARWATGLVVVGALVLGALEGGYAAARWAPFGLAVLWVAVAVLAPDRERSSGPRRVALLAYGLLVAWTALSMAWASTPGVAFDAAGRTALYGLALALALRPRWTVPAVRRLLVLVAAGGTVLAGATLLRVASADDPGASFVDGRLIAPLGYVNATGAMWAVVLPALVHVAAGGVRSPAGRVLALGGAGLVLQTALLSQSRGALIALAVALAVQLWLTSARSATLFVVGVTAAVTALVAGQLLDVRGAADVADLARRTDAAGGRIALASLGLLVLGAAAQVLLEVQRPRRRAALSDERHGRVALRLTAAAGVVALLLAVGNPVAWASDRVDEALHGSNATVPVSGSRLTGDLGSERGDMYRVALDVFASHPLRGAGAEDFAGAYLRERRSDESPRFAHSLPLGVLSGLGLVGLALLLVALGAPLVGALRRRARLDAPGRAGAAAATAGFVAWAVESTWDWTWEFPALSVLALVLLGVAARAVGSDDPADAPPVGAADRRTVPGAATGSVPIAATQDPSVAPSEDPWVVPAGSTTGPWSAPLGSTEDPWAAPAGATTGPTAAPLGSTEDPWAAPAGASTGPTAAPLGSTPDAWGAPAGTTAGPSAAPRGVAAGLADRAAAPAGSRVPRIAGIAVAALLCTLAFASLGVSSRAGRQAEVAPDPGTAARALDRAATWNPFDGDVVRRRAVLARRLGDAAGARSGLEDALRRAPDDWVARTELGIAAATAGERDAAVRQIGRAVALNPREPVLRDVLRLVRAGRTVDPDLVARRIAERSARRFSPTQP